MRFASSRAVVVAFWLAGLALTLPVWVTRYFPAEDAPIHLYWTSVFQELGAAGSRWSQVYERAAHWTTPNLTYFALQYLASESMERHLAQQVVLSLLVLAWVAAIHRLSLEINGRLTIGSFAALLLIHNWSLYVGFFSFLFGIPFLLFALIVLLRLVYGAEPPAGRTVRYVLLTLLGVGAYYSHIVTGVVFSIVVLLAALVEWRRGAGGVGGLLLAAAPPLVLGALFTVRYGFGEGGLSWAFSSAVKRFVGLALWRGFAEPGPTFWTTLALLGLLLALLGLHTRELLRSGALPPKARFVVLTALLLTGVYFLAPLKVGQGGFLNDRLQLIMLAILVPALGARLEGRAAVMAGGVVAGLLVWQVTDFSGRAARFGREYERLLAEADAIPRGSTIRYAQAYDDSHFENSFVGPLMDGAEIAYRCGCVLVEDSWEGGPFYWVRPRAAHPPIDYLVAITNRTASAAPAGGLAAATAPSRTPGLSLTVVPVRGQGLASAADTVANRPAGRRTPAPERR